MATRNAFCFRAGEVDPAGSDLQFEITAEWMKAELVDCDVQPGQRAGTLSVHATPISPGFFVTGTIEVTLVVQCLRCLEMTQLPMTVPIKVHMNPGAPSKHHDEESYGDDGSLGVGHYTGEEIVLDNLVRESIVLALPMSPRCPDGCTVELLYGKKDS